MAKKAALVGTSEFPLFLVRVIDDHHFLVAGGGGKSKTGIPNAIVRICCSSLIFDVALYIV